jgi:phosphoglycolate phosphatase
MYRHILFDFDGTLFDPGDGIVECVRLTLLDLGIDVRDQDLLRKFVGPPLNESFSVLCGLSAQQSEWAKRRYREHFIQHGIPKARPYPGIIGLLSRLRQRGVGLYIASSKQEQILRMIVERHGLADWFYGIYGDLDEGTHSQSKGEIIARVLREQRLDKEGCVMVGDRKFDIIGARENGLDCIAVGFGYGNRQEFSMYEPNYMVEDVESLAALLEGRE